MIGRWCFMVGFGRLERVNRRDSLLAALVATIWGLNFVVIDWGMHDVPPLLFAAIRFTAVVLPAVFLVPRPAAPWRVVAAVGAFMSLGQFGFLYVAMAAGMPPGLAALVLQAQVIFTVLIAAGVLRELPTPGQVVGVLLGAGGLAVVAWGRGGHVPAAALVLCLLGALSWGVGNVVARAARVPGGLGLTVWSATVVPVPLLALSLLLDGPDAVTGALAALSWQAGLSTLYTAGLASLVGYGIFNTLLSRNASSAVVPWVLLAPVVAMATAWLLLDQRPNAAETVGGLVLIVGVLVTLRTPRPSRTAAARSAAAPGRAPGFEPRHGHAERRTADVVQPDLVEEVDGRRVATVLAADAQVQVGARLAAQADRGPHE
jgi:O-acetylserine/cysteine efflux transporter